MAEMRPAIIKLHEKGYSTREIEQLLDVSDGEWPPNSPDLNPLDYSIWSILEAKACAKPYKAIESLKRALIKAWNEITLEQLASIIDNFPKRLKACVEAKGGHFE